MAKARCFCSCHQTEIGDIQEFRQRGQYATAYVHEQNTYMNPPQGVSTSDYVACVMACERCRQFHKPVLDAPPKANEWVDPPPPPKPASGVEGEGDE